MLGEPLTLSQALALYAREGDGRVGTVTCATCGHTWWAHYGDSDDRSGCVADRAPRPALDAVMAGTPAPRLIAGGTGCLCPGYAPGRLPWAIRKHLDGLAVYDDDGDEVGVRDCPGCGHLLAEHGAGYGCWSCPCSRNVRPGDM